MTAKASMSDTILASAPATEPSGQRHARAVRRQHLVIEAIGEERDQRAARGNDVDRAALVDEKPKRAAILRAPDVVQVQDDRQHACVVVPKPILVTSVSRTGRIQRVMRLE